MLVNLKAIAHKVTEFEVLQLSRDNPDTKFETTKEGKLIVMSPTGSSTGEKNSSLLAQIWIWNNKNHVINIKNIVKKFKIFFTKKTRERR